MRPFKHFFTDHPASAGESWAEHFMIAFRFGLAFIGAGLALMVHAFLPFLFVRTGSETLIRLHQEMMMRRSFTIPPDKRPSRHQPPGSDI